MIDVDMEIEYYEFKKKIEEEAMVKMKGYVDRVIQRKVGFVLDILKESILEAKDFKEFKRDMIEFIDIYKESLNK